MDNTLLSPRSASRFPYPAGRRMVMLAVLPALAGCGLFQPLLPSSNPPQDQAAVAVAQPPARPAMGRAQSAAALDTVSNAEKAAALAAPKPTGARELGRTTVALGPPADAGLWVSAPFVTAAGKGRVVTAAGKSLAVELRPGTGGALLSFAAFRALELPLTGLPEVTVLAE